MQFLEHGGVDCGSRDIEVICWVCSKLLQDKTERGDVLNRVEKSGVITSEGNPITTSSGTVETVPMLVVLHVKISVGYMYYCGLTWNSGKPQSELLSEHVVVSREGLLKCLVPFGPHSHRWGSLSWLLDVGLLDV